MDFERAFQDEKYKRIVEVNDEDLGIKSKINSEPYSWRLGARGIVLNSKNEVAVLNKTQKNEFKLIGGGVENGEDPEVAFRRECKEEAGVEVFEVRLLGTSLEYKSQENFKQLSFVFVAKSQSEDGGLELTKKERDEGAKLLWLKPADALEKMQNCLKNLKASRYDSVYRSSFMVIRDIKILKYYLSMQK